MIPALAFGEQIQNDTDGAFNGHHVLVSSAIAGTVQAFIGGQPLLIMGVAEPIVLMYGFMHQFAENEDFVDVFVPWCTWVTIWSSLFLFLFAVTGAHSLDPMTMAPEECDKAEPGRVQIPFSLACAGQSALERCVSLLITCLRCSTRFPAWFARTCPRRAGVHRHLPKTTENCLTTMHVQARVHRHPHSKLCLAGVCKHITKFTRFSGELFGMLIAILFMQQAIKGVVQEFRFSRCEDENDTPDCVDFTDAEKLVNGLWATILALGTVMTSLLIQSARTWRFFRVRLPQDPVGRKRPQLRHPACSCARRCGHKCEHLMCCARSRQACPRSEPTMAHPTLWPPGRASCQHSLQFPMTL